MLFDWTLWRKNAKFYFHWEISSLFNHRLRHLSKELYLGLTQVNFSLRETMLSWQRRRTPQAMKERILLEREPSWALEEFFSSVRKACFFSSWVSLGLNGGTAPLTGGGGGGWTGLISLTENKIVHSSVIASSQTAYALSMLSYLPSQIIHWHS